jgi:hypothetical protein
MNTTFIKSLEKIIHRYMNNIKDSDNHTLQRLENDNIVSYTYHYIAPTGSEKVELSQMMKDYGDYLIGQSSKPVLFKIDSKSKRKAIVNLLIKSELPLDQLDKVLKTLVLNHLNKDFTDIIRYCSEDKTKYSQEVAVKTMNYMGQIANYNSVVTEKFTVPLQFLQEFKFTPDQYPAIHNFFKHHNSVITTKNRVVEFNIVNFLKYSVKADDWHLFSKYCHENNNLKPLTNVAETLFEDNNQLVLNIILKPSYIKAKHPYMASDNDMKNMI